MSQFGVMFFDDSVAAFTNIRAQLEPEGRIAFACWQTVDRNPWFIGDRARRTSFRRRRRPSRARARPDRSRSATPSAPQGILESAGFANVRRTAHDLASRGARTTPSSTTRSSASMGVPPDQMAAATVAVNAPPRDSSQSAPRAREVPALHSRSSDATAR